MLPLLALLVAAPPLDPEAAAPYRWRVAVRFDPPKAVAADFRQRVCRDVEKALRPLVGEVGRVEVHDLNSLADPTPVERLFLKDGWPALESDAARTLTGVKQHFLWVKVRTGGAFSLEARQLDGSAGLLSPAVRAKETRDAQLVGREAGLLVGKEFGAVGTVERDPKLPDRATIRFKGGTLPGFDKHAKAGDIFAVGVVRESRPEPERDRRGRPVPKKDGGPVTLVCQPRSYELLRLEADPVNGSASCKVLTRFRDPLAVPRDAVGVRCLKLLTVDAPLTLRVVGPDGKPPAAGGLLTVRATDTSFDVPIEPRDGLELRDGLYKSVRPLSGVACVVVGLGGNKVERFPLAVTGGGPITLPFAVNPQEAAQAAFERECDDFRYRVSEAVVAFEQFNTTLSDLIVKGKNDQALVRAGQGLGVMEQDDKLLSADLDRLKADPLAATAGPAGTLAAAERELKLLREVRPTVAQKRDDLQAAVSRQGDPAVIEREFRRKELEARIKGLIEAGEVPEALDLFDQLFEVSRDESVKEQKAKLAAEWKPKSDAHKRARDFVAEVWRKAPATYDDLRRVTDQLGPQLGVLTAAEDRLGLRQLLASFPAVVVKLKAVADKLDPAGEADKRKREQLAELTGELRTLDERVRATVGKVEGTAKP